MKLNKYIDHTLLKQDATEQQIDRLLSEAREYDFASVCVNPCWVSHAKAGLTDTDVKVCTVVGFPLGATTSAVKAYETKEAIQNGADEIDMVINVAQKAGADFVKTSTGFSTGGATLPDVQLMRQTVGPDMGVKAAGGARSYADAVAFVEAGATRIGTSSGVAILKGELADGDY